MILICSLAVSPALSWTSDRQRSSCGFNTREQANDEHHRRCLHQGVQHERHARLATQQDDEQDEDISGTMPPPTRRTAREKIPISSRPGPAPRAEQQPNLARPPRHCHRHQREDSRRRQEQPERHNTSQRRRRNHRRGRSIRHIQSSSRRISSRRKPGSTVDAMARTRSEKHRRIGADTDAHGHRRHRARPRRMKYERRFTHIRGRRPDVAHHADDVQPLLGRRRVRDRD